MLSARTRSGAGAGADSTRKVSGSLAGPHAAVGSSPGRRRRGGRGRLVLRLLLLRGGRRLLVRRLLLLRGFLLLGSFLLLGGFLVPGRFLVLRLFLAGQDI